MKIRRYRGPSREKLYGAIQRELGPDAVVVAPEVSNQGVFGRRHDYELIAILEEKEAQALSSGGKKVAVDAVDAERWRKKQARQMEAIQDALNHLHEKIETLRPRQSSETAATIQEPAAGIPQHAEKWDPRFCAWAQNERPGLFSEKPAEVFEELSECLVVEPSFPVEGKGEGPHIIVLAGPTGSGKTTTLAKLAAMWRLQEGRKVGLITTDTYRVAAVDQIKEYATLLGVDLKVVFAASEAAAAVDALKHNDVILVDTPGRNHFDKVGLASIQNVLRGIGAVTVLLTIPASISRLDLPDILKGFAGFNPEYLVITKVDETRQPAVITALPFESEQRIAFITNGQRVPQDIFAARPDKVAELLVS